MTLSDEIRGVKLDLLEGINRAKMIFENQASYEPSITSLRAIREKLRFDEADYYISSSEGPRPIEDNFESTFPHRIFWT